MGGGAGVGPEGVGMVMGVGAGVSTGGAPQPSGLPTSKPSPLNLRHELLVGFHQPSQTPVTQSRQSTHPSHSQVAAGVGGGVGTTSQPAGKPTS